MLSYLCKLNQILCREAKSFLQSRYKNQPGFPIVHLKVLSERIIYRKKPEIHRFTNEK